MSKWKGKLARRIMAIVLSGAMVMSNMSAYAAELVPETSVESVEEVSDAKEQADAENEENGEDVASGGGASTPDGSTPEESTPAPDGSTPEEPAPEESTPAPEESTPEESSEAETSSVEESSEDKSSSEEESSVDESSSEEESSEEESSEDVESVDETIYTVDFGKAEGEDKGGLKTGTTYGNENILTFTVLDNMPVTALTESKISAGMPWDSSIQGGVNPSPNKGKIPTTGAAFKIEAKSDSVIYFVTASGTKTVHFLKVSVAEDGTETIEKDTTAAGTPDGIMKYELEKGFRYYFYLDGSKVKLYGLMYSAYNKGASVSDWNDVAAPAISDIKVNATDKRRIDVIVDAIVGPKGGDTLTVEMLGAEDSKVSASTILPGERHIVSFVPDGSGSYTFKAALSRGEGDSKQEKSSSVSNAIDYKLPLAKPAIKEITVSEDGKVEVALKSIIKEAESYEVRVYSEIECTNLVTKAEAKTETTEEGTVTPPSAVITNLTGGATYYFTAVAMRGEDTSEPSDVIEKEIVASQEPEEPKANKIDLSNGLKPGQEYGDKSMITLSILKAKKDQPDAEDKGMEVKAGAATIDGEEYEFSVQGAENPREEDGSTVPKGKTIPKYGAVFKIDAAAPVNISFALGSAANKIYHFSKVEVAEDGTETIVEDKSEPNALAQATTLKFEMDAGFRYYFYLEGSKLKVYDISYLIDETRQPVVTESVAITTEGLKQAETYGNPELVSINVMEDMKGSPVTPAKVIDGVEYSASVQGSTNPKPDKGAIPNAPAAAFKLTAKQNAKVTFVTGSAAKTYHFIKVDSTGNVVEDKSDAAIPEGSLAFVLEPGYTYYFYADGSKVKVYGITYARHVEVIRTKWEDVAPPVISKAEVNATDKGKIDVTVDAVVGPKGGDSVTIEMFDSEGNSQGTAISKAEKNKHVISIGAGKTDKYTFVASLSRDTEVDENGNETEYDPKESAEFGPVAFTLPLSAPAMSSVTNLGDGVVEVDWGTAKEATGYIARAYADKEGTQLVAEKKTECEFEYNEDGSIKLDEKGNQIIKKAADTSVVMEGFEVGKTYYFAAAATRGADDVSSFSSLFEKEITKEKQNKWSFAAYGSSTSITSTTTNRNGEKVPKNGFSGDFYKGEVNVWSMGGAGKVVPATVDGLAFYYTAIDPKTTNFTLKATAHVNEWVLSNGQDGFGLMAADQVGENGNGDYLWTNSYQAVVSKIEYNWDGENVTTDTTKPKIAMKIGVGATEKIGATKEDVAQIIAGDIATPKLWSTTQIPLDTTYAKYAKAGSTTTCNMVGNAGAWDSKQNKWVENIPPSEASETFVDFELTLQKNNTGYFLSYKMPNGTVMTQKYYDTEALNHIIEDQVYVGFFAARNANVTFKDIEFTTIDPKDDLPAEVQPTKFITLTKAIVSAAVTNTSDYDLIFTSNWDGELEVRNSENKVVGKASVTGSLDTEKAALEDGDNNKDTKAHIELSGLEVGNNVFTLTFTPSKNMKNPPAFTALRTYDPVTLPLTVEYRKYGEEGQIIHVSPTGKSTGTGTVDEPLDIYTAIKYVQPGQTILLEGGRYSLYKTIKIETSVNGKPAKEGEDKYKNYIKMMADPNAKERPVFDFNEAVTGMTLAGNYWYFKGFDVTRSLDGQKGIQLSGSNNVLDQVNAYKNGNTGIQVSGSGNDTYKYWPQNNLILNCSSFLNSDHGYEDADGFAAKLTIGSGNVFDGCIAAYNADDGWDLFAKLESGQIGSVTIKNCVAYKNGYVLKNEQGKLDLEGAQTNAGNGNGFKMGGDGLPGGSIHDEDYKVDENGNPVFSGHKLINSVAFANKSKGFDSNSCSNNKIRNSISFNNEGSNVALYTYSNVKTTGYETEGVISYRTKSKGVADEISAKNQNAADYTNDTTYLWNIKEKAAINAAGNKVAADWFKSTTFKGTNTVYADKNNVLLGRNADGTINMGGFLELTDKAGQVNTGLGGQPSADDNNLKGDAETDGTISVGNGTIVDDTASPELSEEQNAVTSELTANKNYGIYVKYLEEVEYTGTAVKPEFRVYLNGAAFTDYKVSYKNNVNAYVEGDDRYKDIPNTKRPTLILTLKGSYQGTYEYYFDIDPVDITKSVSVSGLSALADGKTKTVAPTLIYNGKKLSAGKDYVVDGGEKKSYTDVNAEGYDVKIDANAGTSRNFKGVLDAKFILLDPANATDISKTAMKLSASSYDYVGKAITPVPDGFNAETMNISYINNVEVGKATITVTGKPETGTVGSKTVPFTIKKAPLKAGVNVNVANFADTKDYTGAALSQGKITVTVKDANGEDVVIAGVKKGSKDVNEKENGLYKYGYTYQYKANTEAGNATLTIAGIHNYTGTANYKFKINPVAATAATIPAVNGKYAFTNKGLEIGYAPTAEYTPTGTMTNVIVKYNGNTVSKKNYAVAYKNNKNAGDSATAVISWKGSLKGTAKTEFTYTINPCDFSSGNITAKSVSDVFTNGKPSIKASDLEKSKVVLVNVKKTLSKNRDYTLEYKYDVATKAADGTITTQTVTYDPQNKEAGKAEIAIDENTGLTVTVYAKPVGTNFKPLADGHPGIAVAEFRVAYYDIAKAKLQVIDKTTEKTTPIYFVDDTETKRANLGALNRLNNHTKNANSTAPYYIMLTHSKTGELSFGNYENRDSADQKNDYTYDYENTATTIAGKQSVTLYGTGRFGGTRVFKYTLVKKTYDLKGVLVAKDTTAAIATPDNAEATTAAIKEALTGKIVINGNVLPTEYVNVSYDASKIQSGKSLSITLTGATVNGIKVYSGFKNVSIKVQ